jgi:H+/gluconate symporter-like permease
MVSINVLALIVAFAVCIPSAVVGFAFWAIERKIDKRDKAEEKERQRRQQETDEREKRRTENEFMTLKCVNAALALGEATAKAVQRIPDAHCNGDMHEALAYAAQVKHEQKDFIERAGVQSIYAAPAQEGN